MIALFLALLIQPSSGPLSRGPTEAQAIQLAKDALREKLGTSDTEIRVERAHAVDWPDAGLGCPEEGQTYPKVPTPGYHVVLRVDHQRYNVRVGEKRAVICDDSKLLTLSEKNRPKETKSPPLLGSPISLSQHPELEKMVVDAKGDLAERLSIDVDHIILEELEQVVWPDSSLGCPKPGMAYIQIPHDGLRIRLSVKDRVYDYHSGKGLPPFLCDQVP